MPILQVDIVGESSDFSEDLAQRIADRAGQVLQSRPQGTWVKVDFIAPSNYAENEGGEEQFEPVFVSIVQSASLDKEQLKDQISQLTLAISSATGRPAENIHTIAEPSAKGRVAFGGKLVE